MVHFARQFMEREKNSSTNTNRIKYELITWKKIAPMENWEVINSFQSTSVLSVFTDKAYSKPLKRI